MNPCSLVGAMQATFVLEKKPTPESQQGVLIRLAREGKGWTQKQLGDRIGLSQRAVSKIECGAGTSSVLIFRIARVLGQNPETFEV